MARQRHSGCRHVAVPAWASSKELCRSQSRIYHLIIICLTKVIYRSWTDKVVLSKVRNSLARWAWHQLPHRILVLQPKSKLSCTVELDAFEKKTDEPVSRSPAKSWLVLNPAISFCNSVKQSDIFPLQQQYHRFAHPCKVLAAACILSLSCSRFTSLGEGSCGVVWCGVDNESPGRDEHNFHAELGRRGAKDEKSKSSSLARLQWTSTSPSRPCWAHEKKCLLIGTTCLLIGITSSRSRRRTATVAGLRHEQSLSTTAAAAPSTIKLEENPGPTTTNNTSMFVFTCKTWVTVKQQP